MIERDIYENYTEKKECPKCHRKQTYDEVLKCRNKCNECGLKYSYKTMNLNEFLKRNDEFIKRKKANLELLREEIVFKILFIRKLIICFH